MDISSLPQLWGLVAGLLLPGLISIVQQPHWSRPKRVAVAVAASVVLGTIAVFVSGQVDIGQLLDFSNVWAALSIWLTTIGAVLTAAQTAYESLWQPSGLSRLIELVTSGHDPNANPEADFHTYVDDYDGADSSPAEADPPGLNPA
jgi:hypothetical protein